MFAEENILGQSEQKADNKGRMIIPSWTKREEGDYLVCIKDIDFNIYRIYNQNTIDSYIEEIKKIKSKCKTLEQLKNIKVIELDFYKSIISKAKIDKQGRFLIGEEISGKTLKLIGAGNNLIISTSN